MKNLLSKLVYGVFFFLVSAQAFAWTNSGVSGVDETTSTGTKIGYAILTLAGLALIIGGIVKLFAEEKSGKATAIGLIALGCLAFGILALWVSKTSGFAF